MWRILHATDQADARGKIRPSQYDLTYRFFHNFLAMRRRQVLRRE
jgi:hypothetical protein